MLFRSDNGIYEYDVTEASRVMNPWLKNYGKDRMTYTAETPFLSAAYHARNEASQSHGYPLTAWLQLGLVYACGLYTAKEQGIVKKKVFFQRFWRAHYFDWLLFARRGFSYGIVGGLLVGTVVFGDQRLALRRAISKWNYLTAQEKMDNTEVLHFIKTNN